MAKKKKRSGAHKAPRSPILIPSDWDRIAQELASEAEMPKMWFIVKLIKQAAEAKEKTNLPPPPWEKKL